MLKFQLSLSVFCFPPSRFRLPLLLVILLGSLVCSARADQLVADTPALTPAEQQKRFHLPPGFAIQLVAAEPDINKPRNMNFDAHGRLWVSHTIEYPFPAKSDEVARDAITIFSELEPAGRARKVHKFVGHLNIPTGLLPLSDREALAWSIPYIYRFLDTNGDGVADERKPVFGPFGFKDTHGNQNAFTRWIDGWVYANHGYYNDSQIQLGGEGKVVLHMQSGNTYRFRPDGSAIEQVTWGQVNPYGLSFDRLGNWYSADCHSRPVTLLLREGYYPSFGKPHDGLGFAPEMTTLDHGGTGIAGIVYNALPGWPKAYVDVLLVGNVISNRVHCDRLKWFGSTPVVEKVEDFLTCDDPWFRPVDIQQGPDGALYIADYYNCIIGHYEVPLTHPKRDRERGRIWRVVYTGEGAAKPAPIDLGAMHADQLTKLLESGNPIVRTQATNELLDRFGKEAASKSAPLLNANAPADATAHALWIAARCGQLDEQRARQLAEDLRPVVRVHLVRALGELSDWQPWQAALVQARIADADPFVRRNVAEALAKHPALGNLPPLLKMLSEAPAEDACLVHATRIALRDQLRGENIRLEALAKTLSADERKALLRFVASTPTGAAAAFILDEALQGDVSDELLIEAVPTVSRELDAAKIDMLVDHVVRRFANRPDMRLLLLQQIGEALTARNAPLSEHLRAPLVEVLKAIFSGDDRALWVNLPLSKGSASASPWVLQQGRFTDEHASMPLVSSLKERSPIGERMGGILRSPEFELPPRFSFWMCGHNGPPKEPDKQRCYIRLRLADGTEVARSYPPRDDVAHPYSWELASHAGQRGYLELVDGATEDPKYGYLAAGRFEPTTVLLLPTAPVGDASENLAKLLKAIGPLHLNELAGTVKTLANDGKQPAEVRVAASECLAAVLPEASVAPLAAVLSDARLPIGLRERSAQQLGRLGSKEAQAALVAAMKSAPQTLGVQIAAGLAARAESAAALLAEVSAGRASPTLLREPAVADRLKSCGLKDADQKVAELTAHLTPADNRIAKLIAARRQGFLATQPDAEAGRAVFAKSVCANCHRIGDVGKNVGPALDGIGSRGLDRLLEDILDPSRNVDQSFRTVMLATDDGEIISGFAAREEGPMTVLTDNKGEPVRVPNDEIVERKTITLSPMPTNAIEQIPPQEFNSLLAYLLSQQSPSSGTR
jgi:putative heme-binding domain-containing protein